MATRVSNIIRPIPLFSSRTERVVVSELDFNKFSAPVKFGQNVSEDDKRKNRNRSKAQRAARRKNRVK